MIAPYSLQQNRVSERKNRTVMEMARCMLFEKKLPKLLWVESVSTSVYLLNRLPTKSVQSKTPIEAWSGKTICQALESVWFIVLPSCAIYQER